MPPSDRSETTARDQPDTHTQRLKRRTFIGASGGVGATLLAGCTAESDPIGDDSDAESPDSDSSTDDDLSGENGSSGNFRLLISDLPADIGDFDSLDVSFDRARIFRAGGDDEDESADDDNDDAASASDTDEADDTTGDDDGGDDETDGEADGDARDDETNGTGDGDDDETEDTGNDSNGRGFFELNLEGATVDLTQVVGGKAMKVFDGDLEPGRYNKIELYAADIEGIVDGEVADVKIPSEKLQIVKPFEVTEEDPVTFVFDINVVRKGHGGYNLLPVITKSGVVGEDVDVEEIDPEDDGDGENEDETGDDDTVEEDDAADDAVEDDGEQSDAPGEGEADDSDEDD
ncbi:DUF4382 domain-containing protein [Natronosalvus vescus]|uniref:DUF4382 domain-containing protein n=1 Tax=Natronosalvus vescus TaxID=2953881 RepID=UPI002090D0F2|nr:DUF4382 domain-containing protein [Natronosalvus vescus]